MFLCTFMSSGKGLFWVISGIIFAYVPLFLKNCLILSHKGFYKCLLYYSNAYCTKRFFYSMPSLLFLVYFWIFFIFLENHLFSYEGGGAGEEHFCYLPLFLQSSSIFFAKFSIDSFAINLTITQIIWLVLWPCKTIWGYAWAHLGTYSFLSKGNQNFLIMFCTEHLGITLMALSTSSPSAWNLVG